LAGSKQVLIVIIQPVKAKAIGWAWVHQATSLCHSLVHHQNGSKELCVNGGYVENGSKKLLVEMMVACIRFPDRQQAYVM